MSLVETVWIDNPPVNLLTSGVVDALSAQLRELRPDTRVVVFRGRGGRAFSAGADIAAFRADGEPPVGLQPLADLIEGLGVPTVAAIDGYCLGGGLEIALACDVRIATGRSTVGLPEVRLGLIPGGGGTQRLPRLVGQGRARWMMLTGEMVDAAKAEAWGLVELVVDDLDLGLERVCAAFALGGPGAQREVKRVLSATAEARSDQEELDGFTRCLDSDEGRTGIAAFLDKRTPPWAPAQES